MINVIPRLHLNPRVTGEEIAGEVKLAFVTRDSVELDEGQLHFWMAGEQRFLILARTEVG